MCTTHNDFETGTGVIQEILKLVKISLIKIFPAHEKKVRHIKSGILENPKKPGFFRNFVHPHVKPS